MKIMNKRFGFVIIILFVSIFVISFVHADSTNTVCCERDSSGAWCQNSAGACDPNYRNSSTSCDATSFCKLGCCVDTQEGLCMENTPEKVCEGNGTWFDDSQCSPAVVPQCNLGCCILGDQASFVTQTRCKQLSSFY